MANVPFIFYENSVMIAYVETTLGESDKVYLHKTEDIIVTLPADTVRCDIDTPQTCLRSKHFTIQTTHLQTFNKHISQVNWSFSNDNFIILSSPIILIRSYSDVTETLI